MGWNVQGDLRERFRPPAIGLLLAAVYCAASLASMRLFPAGSAVICLWFANVALVAIALRQARIATTLTASAVFVGALSANLLSGNTFALSLLFTAANTFSVGAGLWLVRYLSGWAPGHDFDVRSYARILFLAGFVAPALGGAILATVASQTLGWSALPTAWAWLAGDALSFALFLPVLLLATRGGLMALLEGRRPARLLAWAAACIGVAMASSTLSSVPFILVMVPLMLAASRVGPLEVALITCATGLAFVVSAMIGLVPAIGQSETFANGYQIAVAVTVVFPLLAALLIDRMRYEGRQLAESEQRFRRAMDDSAIGVAIVDLEGQILDVNPAFADMLGFARTELRGRPFGDISHPDDRAIADDVIDHAIDVGARSYSFEKRYMRKDGVPVWSRVSGSVIRDTATDKPLYFVSQIENIDAARKSAAAIAEAEARWDFALAAAGQGVWEVDRRKGGVRYSPTWSSMLGYRDGELDGDPDRWLQLVHPDDRERVSVSDGDHMEGRTPYFEAEFRMRHRSGHYIWILDRGKVLERDEKGEVVRALGTLTDITQRKEAEERVGRSAAALADEKERLRVTLAAIGDAVICTDAQDRITFMNPVAEKLTGIGAALAVGETLEAVYRSVDEESGESLGVRRLRGVGRDGVDQNSRAVLVRSDGLRCSIREVVSPIVNEHSEFCGLVIVFQDFTDARTLQRELAYAASHDTLTGLANRSSFMKSIGELAADARRENCEHQLVYVDLDHFKAVNDTSGHAAGDALLNRVSDAIRRTLRPGDIAARLGGDEFAIIFRRCQQAKARTLAQGLVDRLRATDFEWRGRLHTVGASAGLATIDRDAGAVDEIIARADEACYAAKAAGRGRIAVKEKAA